MSNLLNKTLTYDQFCEIVSSAWLYAEDKTNQAPSTDFRITFLQSIEDGVAGKDNPYSMDNLFGKSNQ